MKSNFDVMIYDQFNGVLYPSDKICVAIRTPPGKLVEFHCSSMNDGKDDGINLFSSIGEKIEKEKAINRNCKNPRCINLHDSHFYRVKKRFTSFVTVGHGK